MIEVEIVFPKKTSIKKTNQIKRKLEVREADRRLKAILTKIPVEN